jgi:hypothetical protein
MPNDRFESNVIVLDPSTLWNTAAARPHNLTSKQAGAFILDSFGVIGANIGATPSGNTARKIQIHQNVGDNQYGTVRTQPIDIEQVKAFTGSTASAPQTEVWTLGYDGVDATKTLSVNKNETLQFRFHVYSNKLAKWYNNNPGYNKTVSVYTGAGTGAASASAVADALVIAINNSNTPSADFKAGSELESYVVATKITANAGANVGVRIETIAVTPELLNSADPIKFYEVEIVTLGVSQLNPGNTGSTVSVTKVQAAATGSGFPAELCALEAQAQGFGRVREVFENRRFMKTNYVIFAEDGKKYDYLYLDYDYTHNTGARGASSGQITEPYRLIIAAPTGTLQAVATIFNTWLTNRRPAVTL